MKKSINSILGSLISFFLTQYITADVPAVAAFHRHSKHLMKKHYLVDRLLYTILYIISKPKFKQFSLEILP
ncbi:MAG: hypothetical protein Ct9H90mP3_5770 [Flammeovirgaceae bacterium]|nr:MAG: hypothetical protein Ct9H90mP3_5770 [Flammeovirgaceae bacterium]